MSIPWISTVLPQFSWLESYIKVCETSILAYEPQLPSLENKDVGIKDGESLDDYL